MDPATRIATWQRQAGRHDLPWQATHDPYHIWLSEIMLQQTQAATVIPYYQRFLERFPTVQALAAAPLDAVLHAWAGLGYYARARNLHRCAQAVRDQHAGQFPRTVEALAGLPGIGRSTAAAIAAFAWGTRAPILDGNVRRVLIRYYALESDPTTAASTRQLWAWAQAWVDEAPPGLDMRPYTQGQMDLGATICTRSQPDCNRCPLAEGCAARRTGRQNELPRPRARHPLPQRECYVLVAECVRGVLLQQRPTRGIWGGLWSLPQFDSQAGLAEACQQLGAVPADLTPLAAFEHTFTHFRLLLRPHRIVLGGVEAATARAGCAWVPIDRLEEHGMPTPIHRLLAGLYSLSG